MELTPNKRHIHMYIAGEEVICNKNFTITEEMKNPNTIILNNCYPLSWESNKNYISKYYMPKDYSLFKLTYDYSGYDLATEFGEDILTEAGQTIEIENSEVIKFLGVVKRNSPVSLNPRNPHYNTIQILDFKTFLSEGDVFNFVYTSGNVIGLLNRVLGEYSGYNFVLGNTSNYYSLNATIDNYNCDQKTLYDVLEYICQVTNAVWKVRYVNTTTFAIDFYTMSLLPIGKNLEYDTDFWNRNSIIDISYSFNSNDYRNKQIMTSPSIISKTNNFEEFYATSNDGTYKLSNNVGWITQASAGGIALSCGTKEDKEKGYTLDLCYTPGSDTIEIYYDVLPSQKIMVNYYPELSARISVYNMNEIDRISNQLDNSGIISRYEERKDATTADELNQIGQSYIQYKGRPEITLTVKTLNIDIWEVGQTTYFKTQNIDGMEELSMQYVIKKKTIQQIQNNADDSNYTFYTYELVNNFSFENKINYFDNQRAKQKGNIQEGQYINRYIENIDTVKIIFEEPVVS